MKLFILSATLVLLFAFVAGAQTTEFVYQGQLQNAAVPANGNHDFEFLLFDQLAGGTQIGTMLPRNAVAVANGVFTVSLDFGGTAFPGANRYLQMNVRQTGGGAFTPLAPRTQILSTPYSTRSLNATTADNLTTTGSGNYVQNTTTQQPSSNFNVSGSGTVGSLTTSGAATFGGIAAPASAPTGQGRLYFDSASSKFKVSQNGGAFVDLVGSGGLTGSGAANTIPMFSTATSVGNSAMSQLGGHIGIGLANPTAKLDLFGTGWGSVQRITESTTGNSLVFQSGAGNNMKVTGYNYNTATAVPLFLSVDGANTIMNSGGGSVGIGTTIPGATLDVNTGTHSSSVRALGNGAGHFIAETIGGTNSWARYYMRTPNRSWFIGTSQNFFNDQLYIVDETGGGQIRMSIDTTGKVSLGVLQITGGSDLAENFEFSNKEIKPGMVVAIDPKNAGKLDLARGAYNRRVAGIVSGANNLSAGMLLPDLKEGKNSLPVALSGRVWVYADASAGAIKPGDLLTSSSTPGHAMRVTSYKRAQGAVIGKAITGLKSGRGLVLVLVTLQ
ncbi:MAG: hypothetical protein ACKVRN_01090 [Pyrinomonadaceae bacterium]